MFNGGGVAIEREKNVPQSSKSIDNVSRGSINKVPVCGKRRDFIGQRVTYDCGYYIAKI